MSRARDGGSGEHPGELLTLHVDGDLSDTERRRVEEHLDGCGRCRRVVRDLESLADRARRLPDRRPEEDLWPGVASEIGADAAGEAGGGVASLFRRRWRVGVAQVAAAALVAVLASGVTWELARSGSGSEPAGSAAAVPGSGDSAPAGRPVTGGSSLRWAVLEDAPRGVAELEARYQEAREELDPATRRMLDRNLRLMDRAIAEARRALIEQPDSRYLHQHLSRTMRRKAEILSVAVRMTSAD